MLNVQENSLKSRNLLFWAANIFVFMFWLSTKVVDVYKVAVLGALYEMSSLVLVVLTFALPVILIIRWVKNRDSSRIMNLILVLFAVFNIVFMIYFPFMYK